MRTLSTPQLINLSLDGQYARNLPTTLATMVSSHIANLDIHVRPRMYGRADWPRIDEVLGVRSHSLKRVCLELYETCLADIKPLMPQVGKGLFKRRSASGDVSHASELVQKHPSALTYISDVF